MNRDGLQIALMAALTESNLRMLANTSVYPNSGTYPNDGEASDHDSLGLFQMRLQAGWGTVADLMDPVYQARAFFGGPTGPNRPSPPPAAYSTSPTGKPSPRAKPWKCRPTPTDTRTTSPSPNRS